MQYEWVEQKTKQNIFLNGFYANRNNTSCVLFFPGLAGNFMESPFAHVIAEQCITNNIDFLFAHNQGSFQIISYPVLKDDGKRSSVLRGAAYEHFEDCVYDLDAWMTFLNQYDAVYLVAHSLGCNKVVHYLQEHSPHNLTKIVLLAPQDNVNFATLPIHAGMLEEAKTNIDMTQSDKLLSKKLLGGCVISSKTYYDFITNPIINNIPYKTPNGDMSSLAKLTYPTLVIIGSKEDSQAESYMHRVAHAIPNAYSVVIPEANHIFKNQEQALSDEIISFLTH